jgi:hypothetical protein
MYEYSGENKGERRPWVAEIESLRPMTLSEKRGRKINVMKRLEQYKDNNISNTHRLPCVWGGYVDLSGCSQIFEEALMNQDVPYM